jgi:molecular chaperone GrpE
MLHFSSQSGWRDRIYRMGSLLNRRRDKDVKQTGEVKDLIMRRFEKWLNEVLAEEKPLEGIDRQLLAELEEAESPAAEPASNAGEDRYATWSAITAITQEVKLQGRSFKELSHRLEAIAHLGPTIDKLGEERKEAVADARGLAESLQALMTAHKRGLKAEVDSIARKNFVEILLDIRDRLMIGLKSARDSQQALESCSAPRGARKWFQRKNPDMEQALEIIAALKKGYRLGLERLDETLQQFGVHEIPCMGAPFDPARMTAVDIEETTGALDGTVLDVYRTGYAIDTELIRTAEVKVARSGAPPAMEGEEGK